LASFIGISIFIVKKFIIPVGVLIVKSVLNS
jgi:hypothetical protein